MYSKLPAEAGETPTKVIFNGVEPGSAAARLLYAQTAGKINAFQISCRQQRKLSGGGTYTQNGALPGGGSIRYSYNNGQETLTVYLEPKIVEAAKNPPPLPKGDFWDFALIELAVPDMTRTGAVFCAYAQPEKGDPRGVALDRGGGVVLTDDPYLNYASSRDAELGSGASPTFYSSLKVDMTGMRGRTTLDIDLFGYIEVYFEDGDPVLVGSRLSARIGRENLGTLSPLLSYAQKLGDLGGYSFTDPWPDVQATFPELAGYRLIPPANLFSDVLLFSNYYGFYNGATPGVKWESQSTSQIFGLDVTPEDIIEQFVPPGAALSSGYTETSPGVVEPPYDITYWDAANTILRSQVRIGSMFKLADSSITTWTAGPTVPTPPEGSTTLFYASMIGQYYMPVYNTPQVPQFISRTAQVSSVMAQHGDPFDGVSRFKSPDASNECHRWEVKSKYPDRPGMNVEPSGASLSTMEDPGGDITNHFGMPYLGRMTLDIVHGVAKWKPA